MNELLQAVLNSDEKSSLRQFVSALNNSDKKYWLRNDILQAFADYCHSEQKPAYFFHTSALGKLLHYTHEIILEQESTWLVVRPWIASEQIWRLGANMNDFELQTPRALLDVRDRLVNRYQPQILDIDMAPFYKDMPTVEDPRNIGQGLTFFNHHLCNELATNGEYWLEILFQFLHRLQYDGIPLLTNDRINSGAGLREKVKQAIKVVSELPPGLQAEKFRFEMQELGLEPGWGDTAERVRSTLELFDRLIDTPEPAILEAFVSRIAGIFKVVMVSVHGWVGQEGVIGRPETAGQVAYVIEQARVLENKLREQVKQAGLDILGIQPKVIILTRLIPNCEGTGCDLRLEKLQGTENAWILRVPFAGFDTEVTQNWISRYEIWPYLEKFATDAEHELLAELRGRPNLIIGNYSDGNLVAFLLARSLKSVHCHIAHSLEKPKNLFSNLYWQDLEEKYHFSAQFTADIIGINAADFIITSSYQEIAGTPENIGQYESYKCFTMPQLYHVVDGIDLFNPKFNVVPPGVDENIFFPYNQVAQRDTNLANRIEELIFKREDSQIIGHLDNPTLRPLLAAAPISPVKNLTGLVECFGKSRELQERCNLILLTSNLEINDAKKPRDIEEIEKLHQLINQYQLSGKIRCLGIRLKGTELGEAYRVIADCKGIFVHFARFEAFGRTILEAMISGLPCLVTEFGGASEIIEDSEDSLHLNPTDLEGSAKKILHFIKQCDTESEFWQSASERVIQRVHNKYTWQLHSNQLLLLAKIYGFWDFVTKDNREARFRYLDTLYHLVYKPRAELILQQHMNK